MDLTDGNMASRLQTERIGGGEDFALCMVPPEIVVTSVSLRRLLLKIERRLTGEAATCGLAIYDVILY